MRPVQSATMPAPEQSGEDAGAEPAVAPRNVARGGGDDADDERGLEDFAEDDDGGGEHGGCP